MSIASTFSIGSAQITAMPGNDRLAYRETFEVIREGHPQQSITFCCAAIIVKRDPLYKPDYAGFFESFVKTHARFIPEGSVAIDVGAYDGDTAIPLAYLCGSTGKVYAFECGDAFMSQLSINIGMNPSLHIEGIPAALMPAAGIYEFRYCSTDDNGGHASTNSWVGTYDALRLVRAVSFADFARDKDLSKLSFIKIDTEGHDFHILWSFRDTIKTLRPVIQAEWFPDTDTFIRQMLEYLEYSLFCGFTLEPLVLGSSKWRQDIIMVPTEKIDSFELKRL